MRERHFSSGPAIGGSLSLGDASDAELLERFVTSRDETAFAALMARHGPMVFGVCRRMLRHSQDAEDAFQATFLILVRKAASIGKRELLGHWLYGVAARVAARARHLEARHQTCETADMERIAGAAHEPARATDLSATIMEEVQRLPAKYRAPVVLYYLEGRSSEEVAGEMRCPVGTIKTRLSRAREMLRKRLTRRGLAVTAAAFSTALSAQALAAPLPQALIDSTGKAAICFAAGDAAAGGLVPAQAVALTKGVLHTMFVSKMKIAAAVVLALLTIGGGVGAFAYHFQAKKAEAEKKDKENIQGAWKAISASFEGKEIEADSGILKQELIISADKITVRVPGENPREATYKIDPSANPKTMDVEEEGETRRGLYKLERDMLTICVHEKPKQTERPKDFESKEGSGTFIVVFKREKK